MIVPPVVRCMIPCAEIVQEEKQVSLIKLILNIRSRENPPFPLRLASLCVFVVLREVTGSGRIRFAILNAETNEEIRTTKTKPYFFGNDPLVAFGIPARLHDCVFPSQGVYWLQLWFDDDLLAEQDFVLV